MTNLTVKHRLTACVFVSCQLLMWKSAAAQAPLTLKSLLEQASSYYPTLQAARLDIKASAQELEAARRLYWPTLSAVAEGANNSNVPTSSSSKSIQVEQTLWDAGSIRSRVAESQNRADIQGLKALLLQEEIYLQLVNAWQNLLASKERFAVAQHTILRLQNYQQQMVRRVKQDASPRIDLELAHSRLLQTQVELTAAENAMQQAITRIEQYTGRNDLADVLKQKDAASGSNAPKAFDFSLKTVDWQAVVESHPSVAKAKAEAEQSKNILEQKQAESWPQVYARISQPLANPGVGYTAGPTAYIGIRYSTSPGFANQAQTQAFATRVASANELITAAVTDLQQSLKIDRDEYFNAKSRIDALQQSVKGSEIVLDSYQRQFQAGKKSWLDLLNAVRELAQNQYALADARASMQGAIHRLQIRTGQEIQ